MHRVVVLFAFAFFACSSVRYNVPSEPIPAPKLSYEALKGATVALSVEDARPIRENSAPLVEKVRDTLSKALLDAGLGVSGTGTPPISVRITQYDAKFNPPSWRGCTQMIVAIGSKSKRVERCSDRANVWGGASGDEASADALGQALTDVLVAIDTGT